MKKKIIFAGLYSEDNFGDPIIAKCTEELYRKSHDYDFDAVHLDLKEKENAYYKSKIYRIKNKLRQIFGKGNNAQWDKEKILKLTQKYFKEECYNASVIIFVGGGLIKFKQQLVGLEMALLIHAANESDIPVLLCSVGVEGYSESNKDCQYIKKALSLPCVKYLSTRDDLNTLTENYFDGHPSIKCECVADPAVWASEIYSTKRNETSEYIGLGVARRGIFKEYGNNIPDEDIINMYKDIIRKLLEMGKKVMVFTNGLYGDNLVAQELQNVAWGGAVGFAIPKSPSELIHIISNFKAVIATRLHACIISYSLNIPVVGLVWNNKLKFFGQNIGRPDNFVTTNNLSSDYVLTQLNKALKIGYDDKQRKKFRATIANSIASFDKYL